MSFFRTAKVVAQLILGLSPIVMDATRLARTWKKKGGTSKEDLPTRVERLEKSMELQSNLNEQYVAELHILKPALEGLQRSIRLAVSLALFACLLASAALVLWFFK